MPQLGWLHRPFAGSVGGNLLLVPTLSHEALGQRSTRPLDHGGLSRSRSSSGYYNDQRAPISQSKS